MRALRIARGLSVRELAEACGRDRTWVYHVERGRSGTTLGVLAVLAGALSVDELDLFNFPGTDPRHDLIELTRGAPLAAIATLKTLLEERQARVARRRVK